jgi:cytochrome b6-f complex iron-sulfur subunit
MNNDIISRKKFLKKLGFAALIPFGAAWYSSVARDVAYSRVNKVKLKYSEIENGITFKDEIIINKKEDGIKIFSSRCSHLGCKLNKMDKNEIVCPCHGSRFSIDGKIIKGPANNNLKELSYSFNKSAKEIVIDVPA